MSTIDKMEKCLNEMYEKIQGESNGRYKSWEYCFKAFADARNQKEKDFDLLSLNLAFYLASWGMYRGSSFLLQKDYKVHTEAVKIILQSEYDKLFSIKCIELKKEENLKSLSELYNKLAKYYQKIRNEIVNFKITSDVSEILITKILLGTLGCVPAYDRFFKLGLSAEKIGIQKYGDNSLIKICEFYEENQEILESIRSKMKFEGLEYPQLKVIDMGFWQIGFDVSQKVENK